MARLPIYLRILTEQANEGVENLPSEGLAELAGVNAAKVRKLGQVELVIAFAIAFVKLGERHARSDYAASALVLLGVVTVTLLG